MELLLIIVMGWFLLLFVVGCGLLVYGSVTIIKVLAKG